MNEYILESPELVIAGKHRKDEIIAEIIKNGLGLVLFGAQYLARAEDISILQKKYNQKTQTTKYKYSARFRAVKEPEKVVVKQPDLINLKDNIVDEGTRAKQQLITEQLLAIQGLEPEEDKKMVAMLKEKKQAVGMGHVRIKGNRIISA